MSRDDGVGLAAPQVGMNIRMMVFNPYGREKPGSESILVNPGAVLMSCMVLFFETKQIDNLAMISVSVYV